jgi:hypothetical protein
MGVSAPAEANDLRRAAMGGVSMGIPEGSALLQSNPAGLAFIADETFSVTTDIGMHAAGDISDFDPNERTQLGGFDPYELRYQNEANSHHIYYFNEHGDKVYTFGDDEMLFDQALASYGFSIEDPGVITEIRSWYDNVQMTGLIHDHIHHVSIIPSTSFSIPGFAFSYQRGITAYGNPDSGSSNDQDQYITVAQDEILRLGFSGTDPGILSFGASGNYNRRLERVFKVPEFEDYGSRECEDFDDITMKMVEGSLFKDVSAEHLIDLTLGAMLRLGGFSGGAAVNIPVSSTILSEIADHVAIGVAYDSDPDRGSPLSLLSAVDITELLSDEHRMLHSGAEIELSMARRLHLAVRVGYEQPIPGKLESIFNLDDLINLDTGRVTFGSGIQVFNARIDAMVGIPARSAQDYMNSWIQQTDLPDSMVNGGPVVILSGSTVF